jgi:hypothetical protein
MGVFASRAMPVVAKHCQWQLLRVRQGFDHRWGWCRGWSLYHWQNTLPPQAEVTKLPNFHVLELMSVWQTPQCL